MLGGSDEFLESHDEVRGDIIGNGVGREVIQRKEYFPKQRKSIELLGCTGSTVFASDDLPNSLSGPLDCEEISWEFGNLVDI